MYCPIFTTIAVSYPIFQYIVEMKFASVFQDLHGVENFCIRNKNKNISIDKQTL